MTHYTLSQSSEGSHPCVPLSNRYDRVMEEINAANAKGTKRLTMVLLPGYSHILYRQDALQ